MKALKVGILGATGAVGEQMRIVLAERKFPISELRLFGSARSAGTEVEFDGKMLKVVEATPEAFEGLDLLLGAADNDVAKKFLPDAAKKGIVVVDNSSAFRLDPEVPLVIPEVNPEDVKWSKGLIANPNCATIIALTAVAALHRKARLRRMVASTYQAVSGAGRGGMEDLEEEVKTGRPVLRTFPYPIAYNLIPQIGGFNDLGYTSEEMKLQNEGRKMLHDDTFLVSCTCVRVPIMRSHSEALTLEFEKEISPEEAREILQNAPGVKLWDDPAEKHYPMPMLTSDQDLVYVGRVRRDLAATKEAYNRSLSLFCCADQIRKGAATNAIQIAEIVFGINA
ncbi:aspartate-semialdehyde dehydrogenase [Sutterella seckii]|mgnify:CR=1 FL=1|uniref:Aspartate-semialdehyde dehydrogenase n=1 Tax=Sutterella seckii TaxID=1944635 RepID=A0AAI9SAC7_9BURK|nr:aspartate-semialdehyde dehydrogenase [Sutterella seckii]KAB7650171.1 aspartate-semialdehyde dehydrogenase [Sutterella seckii]